MGSRSGQAAVVVVAVIVGCGTTSAGRPVPIDALRKACAFEASCLTSPPYASASACFSSFELSLASGLATLGPSADDIQRYADCATRSSDCASALACASRNHDAAWCAAHPSGCDGDLLVGCTNGWGLFIRDCASRGGHCISQNGYPSCSDGKTCVRGSPDRCVDGHLFVCDWQTQFEYDAADCASGGCTERCDGTAWIACPNGRATRVDCARIESHCDAVGDAVTCIPNATECTASAADTCSGDAIVMCVNGRNIPIACASIGLSTCQAGRCK